MKQMINVALPKGRLGEKVLNIFEQCGYECPSIHETNRKLIFENEEAGVRYFWVKPSDVSIYVERGAADIGVAGKDILLEIPVSAVDATLGVSLDIPTIHGDVTMKIPAGTQDGARLRLKGKGVADLRGGRQGDQICTVRIKVDTKLSSKEKELYRELQKLQSRSGKESAWDKFRNMFS